MVFNKKYTEILKIAAGKDAELEKVLKKMLSLLNAEQKEKCFKGEEFHNDENTYNLENFDRGYKDAEFSETYLIIEDGNKEYRLNIVNFNRDFLDQLDVFDSVDEAFEAEREASDIFTLDYFTYKDIAKGDMENVVTYTLMVTKLKNQYVLEYYRVFDDGSNAEKDGEIMKSSVVTISEEELFALADMECSLTIE